MWSGAANRKPTRLRLLVLCCLLLGACSGLEGPAQLSLIPTEHLPTAIALTLQARGVTVAPPLPARSLEPEELNLTPGTVGPVNSSQMPGPGLTPSPSATFIPTASLTLTPSPTLDLTALAPRPGAVTRTLAPPLPDAVVQIFRLGELSLVTSPIQVITQLSSEWGKVVRIELYGEDGRLLARYLRAFQNVPWDNARVDVDLDFEISAAGEAGRLVVSVEDPIGRIIDVNSVNLILMSSGTTQLNPATALHQRLIIQEPTPQELILGGKLIISGRGLLNRPDQPLRVMLVAGDGRVLGQRLARVDVAVPGDYGAFVAEVPYQVAELTSARLIVYEEGEPVSDIAHLASIEVNLGP